MAFLGLNPTHPTYCEDLFPISPQIISMPKYLSGTYLVLEHNNERDNRCEKQYFFSSDNKANRSRSRVKGIRGTSSVYCLSVKKLMCGTIFHNLSFVIKCSKKRRCCCSAASCCDHTRTSLSCNLSK